MSYVRVDNGVNLPLALQLGDGNTGKFPQAKVYDSSNTLQATKSLTHVANGLYTDSSFTPSNASRYTIQYIVYQDSGHTIEDVYPRTMDIYDVRDVGPLSTDYTASRATKIDNLDATVSSRLPTTTFTSTIGSPAGASVSADIAAVKSDTGTLTSRLTSGRATNLDNLDATVSSRNSTAHFDTVTGTPVTSVSADIAAVKADTGTLTGRLTSGRATNLDNLDATVSSRLPTTTFTGTIGSPAGASVSADIAAVKVDTAAIRTTLGAPAGASVSADIAAVKGDTATLTSRLTSGRATNLDNLDATVSSRVSTAHFDTVTGTPAVSVSADIAAVKVDTAATRTTLGAPAGASVSADIAAVKSDTGGLRTDYTTARAVKIDNLDATVSSRVSTSHFDTIAGTPAVSISADIAAVKGDTGTTVSRLGVPVGSTISADIANVQSTANGINTKLGSPAGASVSADIAAVKGDTATLTGRLTSGRATNLDNLDATITSRESEANAATRASATASASATILTAVESIQNNTNFSANVPTVVEIPMSGSSPVLFYAYLFDDANAPSDPDSNIINVTIKDESGATVAGPTAMTRLSVGKYTYTYTVLATDPERLLNVFFNYAVSSVAFEQSRPLRVTADNSDLSTLLSRLTEQRAENLDFLDVAVSSRAIEANEVTRYNAILAAEATTQAAVAGVQTKLGAPVSGSVSLDIAAVRLSTDKIGAPANGTLAADIAAVKGDTGGLRTDYTTARAAKLDNLDVAVSSRVSTSHFDAVVGAPAGASLAADVAAVKSDTGATVTRIGTPAVSVSADIAAVKADTGGLRTDITTGRAANLDNLDVAVSSRVGTTHFDAVVGTPVTSVSADIAALQATENTVNTKLGTPVVSVSADVAAVKSDTGTLTGRLTAPRAANLDNLDVASSTRLSTTHFDAVTGVPVASIAADIAALQTTENIINTKIGTPAVTVSADLAAVDSDTSVLRARLTSQRAANLDNLDVAVTTRQSSATALSQFATIDTKLDSLLTGLGSVQSGSTFRIAAPVVMEIPASSSRTYNFYGELTDSIGNPTDSDGVITYTIRDTAGTTVFGPALVTPLSIGHYQAPYVVNAGDPLRTLEITFNYDFNLVSMSHVHVFEMKLDETKLDAIKARTDFLPSDFSNVALKADVAAQAKYVNRMTTVFNNLTGIQEILVWSEKNGQVAPGTNCAVSVRGDNGAQIWAASAALPDGRGVFSFSHTFGPVADGNYYVEISIDVDSATRTNKQPFVAVG